MIKNEILELTQEILANSAPKAAFKLVEIMESNRPIVQANNKLSAAQTLLDRVGVSKIDKLDVNHNLNSGMNENTDDEIMIEAYYSYPINDGMTVTPLVYSKEQKGTGLEDLTGVLVKTSFSF